MLSIWTTLSNMGNEFYSPGEQRATQVNKLFATIATRYDLINDIQSLGAHRRWKRRVASLAAVKSGDSALDLCCGTGDISFALAKSGATVTGLDFSEAMLAVADREHSLIITGVGDVLEPELGIVAIGSGGSYAQSAARALLCFHPLLYETASQEQAT